QVHSCRGSKAESKQDRRASYRWPRQDRSVERQTGIDQEQTGGYGSGTREDAVRSYPLHALLDPLQLASSSQHRCSATRRSTGSIKAVIFTFKFLPTRPPNFRGLLFWSAAACRRFC